ncbi:MAG: class I SAM-dependent methyltransferase [Actinobacteria bacterium]|nr:MAG: class I SAM-dependent methyltransferase [Actinomycetota bacterium]
MSAQTTGAEAWDDRYSSSELVWTLEPNRWVVEVLAEVEPAGRRALDLGAGEGRNSIWLAQRGWRVEAVDFSAVGLDRARQLAAAAGVGDRLVTVVDDVVDFTPAPGGFALALLCYLQLPRSERMLSVRNAARGVAPGGLLVVVAHDSSNLEQGTGGPQSADVLYTAQDVMADLGAELTNWEVLRAEVVQRPVAGAPRPALDALAVLRRTAAA